MQEQYTDTELNHPSPSKHIPLGLKGRVALAAFGLFTGTIGYHLNEEGSKPATVVECGDGQIAPEWGDFTQAAREAGAEVGASTDTDYLAIGTELGGIAVSPLNPEGYAYSGHSVWLAVGKNGAVESFGHGTCEQPTWPQGD